MERTREQRNQLALIGAAILDAQKCQQSILRLYPVEFEAGPIRDIFKAIRQLVKQGKSVDVISLENLVGSDCRQLLVEAAETTPAVNHVEDYEALIVEDFRCHELRSAIERIALDGGSSDTMCAGLRAQLDRQDKIRNAQSDDTAREFSDVVDETMEALTSPDTSLKLGWREIDRFGFFERTNAVVLSARPGGGKTDLAISLAARFSRQYRVYYLTMEESRRKLMARILSRCSRIDASRIRDKKLSPEEMQSLTISADKLRGHHNMILDSDAGITVEQIRGKLLRYKPDIAFIDHIGLIQGSNPKQKECERLQEATRELKNIAMEMDIVIVELSQMNRSVDRTGGAGRAEMSDLRGSGTIEQDANAILFINAPPDDGEEPLRGADAYKDVEVRVKKNREGAQGKIMMRWQPQYHDWQPTPDAEDDFHDDPEPLPEAVQQQFDAIDKRERRLGNL